MKTIKTTFMILIIVMMNQFTNAQIVYTNLQPDVSLKCQQNGCINTYSLDLNNDGSPDFGITASKSPHYCNGYSNYVSITALNGNSVALSSASNATAFVSGNIHALLSWSTTASPIYLRWVYDTYFYCSYVSSVAVGNWSTTSDKYLGLKLISNNQTYYGWARLKVSVSKSGASFTIKDYAYDSTPNHSILAGATSGARLGEEISPIENNLLLSVFPNPVSISTTISFSLSQSQKISLKIIDVNGRLVSTLADKIFEEGENEIAWNASDINAGVYFLQFHSAETLQTEKLIVTK